MTVIDEQVCARDMLRQWRANLDPRLEWRIVHSPVYDLVVTELLDGAVRREPVPRKTMLMTGRPEALPATDRKWWRKGYELAEYLAAILVEPDVVRCLDEIAAEHDAATQTADGDRRLQAIARHTRLVQLRRLSDALDGHLTLQELDLAGRHPGAAVALLQAPNRPAKVRPRRASTALDAARAMAARLEDWSPINGADLAVEKYEADRQGRSGRRGRESVRQNRSRIARDLRSWRRT